MFKTKYFGDAQVKSNERCGAALDAVLLITVRVIWSVGQ